MPERTIASFHIKRLDILDEQGAADESLLPPLSPDEVRRLYRLLVLSRTFDRRALSLQREGRIGTYASVLGQEASQVGSALAVTQADWVFPSFREMAVFITLGYPLPMLLQYWSGDERGLCTPAGLNIFPVCIPVATHVPHAVGAALAAKHRGDSAAAVAYFGDGGTSKGDFHEGLNFAGIFRAPVVFICQNNHWAISVRRERQTASETLAQKAVAYGFPGIQVDGNDVFAVYRATKEALDRARSGAGPTLIECFTYRMSDHTTADDASRYRSREEVEEWKEKDPLLRLMRFMEKRSLLDDAYRQKVEEDAKKEVDEAVRAAESVEPPDPKDMLIYTAARLNPRQARQARGF